MPPIAATTLTRLQILALLALLVGSVGLPWLSIRYSDGAVVVSHRSDGAWITAPQPARRAKAIPILRSRPPTLRFERSFRLAAVPERVGIQLRALRLWSVSLNGQVVGSVGTDGLGWKRARPLDLTQALVAGENLLAVEVTNPTGPVLLQTWSEELPEALGTGEGWMLAFGEKRVPAVVAQDVRIYPDGSQLPNPLDVIERRWLALILVFLLCAAPVFLGTGGRRRLIEPHLPRAALAVVALVWLGMFVRKALELPLVVGFDAEAHLDYIRFLIEERRVPRADEGWEMFHPPLYHGLAAGLRTLFSTDPGSVTDRAAVRLFPMLSGFAGAWLAGRTSTRLWPERPGVAAVAVLAAGLLPMNLYISAFVSPESLHAAWVGAGIWIACVLLMAPRAGAPWLVALSIVLGLALVTKSTTGLPVAALLVLGVGAKLWLVEDRPPARAAVTTVALLAGPVVLAGWFYARNWLLFADPFITNLDAFETRTYWLPPGFHTPPWLHGFGEVFTRPFFASFHSYWDGFYSSFWGDGYASGRAGVLFPNPWWDYETMVSIYPLALPACAIFALGFGVCIRDSLRGSDLGRRMALSILLAIAVGMLLMSYLTTLRLPINAMPKAFYTLPALVPFAVGFAAGTGWLWSRAAGPYERPLRAGLCGYLGMLGFSIAAAFLR